MVAGALVGWLVHRTIDPGSVETSGIYGTFDGLATIFLKLLRMVVIPLVVFSLLSGVLGIGDVARLGRTGLRTLALYVTTTLIALMTGLLLVNVIRPGAGLDLGIPAAGVEAGPPPATWDFFTEMIPQNIVQALAEFDLLGVILFTILFGTCLLALKGDQREVMSRFIEAGAEVMLKMTGYVLTLAPVGIAALIARMVASTGLEVFTEMLPFVFTVFGGLMIHALITLPLLIWLVTRTNPYRFLRVMSPALVTGFSTASSSGTLAVTLERAEKGAGISNRVAGFVLPIGATVNMDGTALYEIVTVLFIAQVHAGIDPNFTLTLGQQLLIVFLGLAVSIGAAGIPHAGLVMMVIILQAVKLPVEYTALIWAVDRPLDMCRTMVNIASDSSITLIVASREGEVDPTVLGNSGTA